MLFALTRFEILAGMRSAADAGALFEALAVPELAPIAADLAGASAADGGSAALTRALAKLLSWPLAQRSALIAAVVAACERLAAGDGPYAAACAATVRIAGDHPGDMGIVASLLLRHAVLEPGQAVFMRAGGLHAYLHGTGIELMANSDNVVRAGLTGKHIDISELLKLTDPSVGLPLIEGRDLGDGVSVYESPAPEFRLYRAELGRAEITLPAVGPRLVLCMSGTVSLTSADGAALKTGRGESCFLSAMDGEVRAAGPGVIFVATTGIDD
jgi:mannose-6-phosphate isomerase